jgi:uncharacterized OsmC-like protein
VPLGEGAKTVYVQFKDTAGLVSTYYSDTIMLETPKETPKETPFPTTLLLAGIAGTTAVVAALIYLKKKR